MQATLNKPDGLNSIISCTGERLETFNISRLTFSTVTLSFNIVTAKTMGIIIR